MSLSERGVSGNGFKADAAVSVLAIDSDRGTLALLKSSLPEEGFDVTGTTDLKSGIDCLIDNNPQFVLTSEHGFTAVKEIKKPSTSLIVLHDDTNGNRSAGFLDNGADHVELKPLSTMVLASHMRAIERRRREVRPEKAEFWVRDLHVDLEKRVVTRDGETINLTRTERQVFNVLAANRGRVMTSEEIINKVWGGFSLDNRMDDLQNLRVWISRLRGKFDDKKGKAIRTIHGVGYVLGAEEVKI